MSDTVVGAVIGVLGALAGVAIASSFTLLHDSERERREKESTRTLLSLELLQNATAIITFRAALEATLGYPDSRHVTAAFLVTAVAPRWEKVRWNSLEVGRHLTPSELMRMGEWYTKLDGLTFLYERLTEQVRRLQIANGSPIVDVTMGEHVIQQIRGLVDYANELRTNAPPLLDAKLSSGDSVQDYLKDLLQRESGKNAESRTSIQANQSPPGR